MQPDIKPGSVVRVEVTKNPASDRAAKTLSRLFKKDPTNARADRLRKKTRTRRFEDRRRGGRIWVVRPSAPRFVQPEKGATCKLLATSDVLRDLGSVSRFVKVSTAD